ncbi:hypothetical protein [Mesorhizobium huakuii]|uniref:Uncharacterized protein n=1 Tax=Mesorhizobium huakuii TaxID=28104 RepID=A0A7G6T0N4_9HYPH|nr:hypothetical protein [Mesorhizobium huakuii]QND60316.1 hypothetical protein HB778_30040 [Mesorhizobium huakuii]
MAVIVKSVAQVAPQPGVADKALDDARSPGGKPADALAEHAPRWFTQDLARIAAYLATRRRVTP